MADASVSDPVAPVEITSVPIRGSVADVCPINLEDGHRSLATLGMTPADDPRAAPAHARKRSEPAESVGLGA